MNKLLTISIAAYNVEKYIRNTLDSLLIKDIEELEILVEDDGGTDNTANIVKEYEKKYPGIVKLVHKENGGYGSTINKSIELATGKYFKQLDGDDWFDTEGIEKILKIIRNTNVDVIYTPYTEFYERKELYNIRDFFLKDINGEFFIEDILLKTTRYLSMYTLTYKTNILKENNVKLIEKCFYTDTEYAIYPMTYCNTIYVTHIPVYMYRIGREGQSVSLEGRLKHYSDHLKVSNKLINFWNKEQSKMGKNKQNYIFTYVSLDTATSIGDFLILLDTSEESLNKIKEFERNVLELNHDIYINIGKISKTIFLLRKTNYKLYKIISFYKRRKYKKD